METDKRLKGLLALKAIADHILTIQEWETKTWRFSNVYTIIKHCIDLPEVKATDLQLVYDHSSDTSFPVINKVDQTHIALIYSEDYDPWKILGEAFGFSPKIIKNMFSGHKLQEISDSINRHIKWANLNRY